MSMELKPHLFHSFKKIDDTEDFEVFEFVPSLLKAFPFRLEKISLPYRIRCIQEFFIGYKVYYIRKNGLWGGYCIVSNGKNPRYEFCEETDITFGRYFVIPDFRGNGLATKMVNYVLNITDLQYKYAYAYVHAGNKASHATMAKLGAIPVTHFDKVGHLMNIVISETGKYTVYRYQKHGCI